MLVLTRKLQEQIRIGEDVVITILQVRGRSVRVGVEAPRDIRVLRAELPPNNPAAPIGQVTTVELTPTATPTVKTQEITNQPLASRLQARRAPSARMTSATGTEGRLGPALLALAAAVR